MDLASTILDARLPDGNMIRFRPFSEGDAEMIKDVYLHGHYDSLDLNSGDVVFDVGAHIGSFAFKAARLVGAAWTTSCPCPWHSRTSRARASSPGQREL